MGALGLMAVHAHPDDEVILTGGVLARAADRGVRTAVVTATGGERGEVVGEGLDAAEVAPKLAEVRAAELAEALDLLGAGAPRFLGYEDSGMMGEASNEQPQAFWKANFDEAVRRLVAHLREFRPDVVVTYDAFGGYGHPDHIQAHRVTVVAVEAAAAQALYPAAGPPWRVAKTYLATFPKGVIVMANRLLAERGLPSPFGEVTDVDDLPVGTPDHEVTTTVDVRPWLAQKMAALRAHRTQLGPESFFLNIPDDLSELAFGTEWFIRHRSSVPVPDDESDLFAGLGGE